MTKRMPPDNLTQRIGVLTRREVEARILAPIVNALGDRFGRDEVVAVVRDTIVEIAKEQGEALTNDVGGAGAEEFMAGLRYWTQDDALQIELLAQGEESLDFNVRRCRYAEMYQALGIPELGAVLSCNRDFALIEGFNPDATLERTQTIMKGADRCDFRYTFPSQSK